MNTRAYLAEIIGTFLLTLGVIFSLAGGYPIPTPVVAGLTVGIMVYAVGAISGAHFNPAVTVGLASVKKIDFKEAAFYIISQFLGAILAMFVANLFVVIEIITEKIEASNQLITGLAEAIGAFILVFAISAVVHKNVKDDASGITIGGALIIGAMAASIAGNGVINPAVAVGIGSVSLMYVVGPLLGGIGGAWAYKYIANKK